MTTFRAESPPFVAPRPGASTDEAGREQGRDPVPYLAATSDGFEPARVRPRDDGWFIVSTHAHSLAMSRADLERIVAEGRAVLQEIQRREALDRINAGGR